jgi:hypothetical protein
VAEVWQACWFWLPPSPPPPVVIADDKGLRKSDFVIADDKGVRRELFVIADSKGDSETVTSDDLGVSRRRGVEIAGGIVSSPG